MQRTDLKRYHMLQDNSVSLYAQRSGNQGNSWQFLELQFTTSVSEKIYIEGVQGTNFNGDIAIDDIKLLNSNCPTQRKGVTEGVREREEQRRTEIEIEREGGGGGRQRAREENKAGEGKGNQQTDMVKLRFIL